MRVFACGRLTLYPRRSWERFVARAGSRLVRRPQDADFVVIGSYVGQGTRVADATAPTPLVDFTRAMIDRNRRVIVVAFGNPYLYRQLPFVPTYVVAWSGFVPAQRAAARALSGAAPISGRLPISIPPHLRLGTGETRPARAP